MFGVGETRPNLKKRIEYWAAQRKIPTQAITFLKCFQTSTKPALFRCADGQNYVVKGRQVGRFAVNDHIVAQLGTMMKAPVSYPRLIAVPDKLIEIEPELSHFQVGLAHGSMFISGCFDSYDCRAVETPINKLRVAHLSVLYGWTLAYDHQFLYQKSSPQLIYSVDHSHFFPLAADGEMWDVEALKLADSATLDSVFDICNLQPSEIHQALRNLASVSKEDILKAVASPPDEWGITMDERVAMAEYLVQRQQDLLSSNPLRDA